MTQESAIIHQYVASMVLSIVPWDKVSEKARIGARLVRPAALFGEAAEDIQSLRNGNEFGE
jgi:hypothetical protein